MIPSCERKAVRAGVLTQRTASIASFSCTAKRIAYHEPNAHRRKCVNVSACVEEQRQALELPQASGDVRRRNAILQARRNNQSAVQPQYVSSIRHHRMYAHCNTWRASST